MRTTPKIMIYHEDGWKFEIVAFEEETTIYYFERKSETEDEFIQRGESSIFTSFEHLDEKIANGILLARKMYKELNDEE
jgi:hypothetical protein